MDEVSKHEELAYVAGAVASENYAAQCRAEDKPLTTRGLKAEIRKEVFATIGQPPTRMRPAPVNPVQPIGNAWVDLTSAVQQVATPGGDLPDLAARTPARLQRYLLDEARGAAVRLSDWIAALESQTAGATAAVTYDQPG